jgi:hypothetical protein
MSPQKPPIAKSPHHPFSPIYRGIEAGGSQSSNGSHTPVVLPRSSLESNRW